MIDLERAGVLVDTLLGPHPLEARGLARDMVAAGLPARDFYLRVLSPALVAVGRRWQLGLADVAQEHLASAIASSIMATMGPAMDQAPANGQRAILACSGGELHRIGLRMVADFLEADGWEVLYLGAQTPGPALAQLVNDLRPDVVGISTALTSHLDEARVAIELVKAEPDAPFVIVGGHAYGGNAETAHRLGADAYAIDAGAASVLLRDFGLRDDGVVRSESGRRADSTG